MSYEDKLFKKIKNLQLRLESRNLIIVGLENRIREKDVIINRLKEPKPDEITELEKISRSLSSIFAILEMIQEDVKK